MVAAREQFHLAVRRVAYRQVVMAKAMPGQFDEQKHPRAGGGKFGDKPDQPSAGGAPGAPGMPAPIPPKPVNATPGDSSKVWDEAISRLIEEGFPFNKQTVTRTLADMGLDSERVQAEMTAADPQKLQAQYAAMRDRAAAMPHEETRHGNHTVWQLKPGSDSHPLQAEPGVQTSLPDFDPGPEARKAIEAYTSSGKYEGHAISAVVNGALRADKLDDTTTAQVAAIRSAMRPTTADMTMFRAVDAETMRNLFGDDHRASVGSQFVDRGFVSLGADPKGTERFLGAKQNADSLETTADGVLLRVKVPAGTNAYRVGSGGDSAAWASEQEVILDAGQQFRVTASGEVRSHQSHRDRGANRSGRSVRVLDVELVPAAPAGDAPVKKADPKPLGATAASPERAQADRLTGDFEPELLDPEAEDDKPAPGRVSKDAMMQMQDVTVNSPVVQRARRRKRRKAYEDVIAKHRAGQHDQLKHGRRGGQPGRGERRKAALDAIRRDYERARDNVSPERKARGEARIAGMNERADARKKAKAKAARVRKPSTPKDPQKLAEQQAARAEKPSAAAAQAVDMASVRTMSVPMWSLGTFRKRVDALNKRAESKGLEGGFKVGKVGEPYEDQYEYRGEVYKREMVDVDLHGTLPTLPGGWKLVAAIDHGKGANVVRGVPGAEGLVDKWGHQEARCDHCNTSRDRKYTVLVANDDGEHKLIGKSCVKDFFGRDVALFSDKSGIFDDPEDFLRSSKEGVTPHDLLTMAAAAVAVDGYRKAGDPGGSTADTVRKMMFAGGSPTDKRGNALYNLKDPKHREGAEKMLEWVRSGGLGTSDWAHNVKAALSDDDGVNDKHVALAVSAIAGWQRHEREQAERQAAAERTAAKKDGGLIGKPGDKVQLSGKVVHVADFGPSDYGRGNRMRVYIETGDGNVVWHDTTSATDFGRNAEKGMAVQFGATVKAHRENQRGEPVTTVQRPTKVLMGAEIGLPPRDKKPSSVEELARKLTPAHTRALYDADLPGALDDDDRKRLGLPELSDEARTKVVHDLHRWGAASVEPNGKLSVHGSAWEAQRSIERRGKSGFLGMSGPLEGIDWHKPEPEAAAPAPKPARKPRATKPKAPKPTRTQGDFTGTTFPTRAAAEQAAKDADHEVNPWGNNPTAFKLGGKPAAELFDTGEGWRWEPLTHPDRGPIAFRPGDKTYGNRGYGDRIAAKLKADGFGHHVRAVEARYNVTRDPVDPYSRAADYDYDVDRNDSFHDLARKLGYRVGE